MSGSQEHNEQSPSQAPSEATTAAQGGASGGGARANIQLRGMPYEQQLATLTPRSDGAGPAVQKHPSGGGAELAPSASPGNATSDGVMRLGQIATGLFVQLAEHFATHVHLDLAGSPSSAPMIPLTMPLGFFADHTEVGALARALSDEFNSLVPGAATHMHADGLGNPSVPPVSAPLPHYISASESDVGDLARSFQSDLDLVLNWLRQHIHANPNGPMSPPVRPPILNDTDLITFISELAASPPAEVAQS